MPTYKDLSIQATQSRYNVFWCKPVPTYKDLSIQATQSIMFFGEHPSLIVNNLSK